MGSDRNTLRSSVTVVSDPMSERSIERKEDVDFRCDERSMDSMVFTRASIRRNDSIDDAMLSEIPLESGIPSYLISPCPQLTNAKDQHTYVANPASLLRGRRAFRLERSQLLDVEGDLDGTDPRENWLALFRPRTNSFECDSERSTMAPQTNDTRSFESLSQSSSRTSLASDSEAYHSSDQEEALDMACESSKRVALKAPVAPNTNRPRGRFGNLHQV